MSKLKKVIQRIIGKPTYVYPIFDKIIYSPTKGYAGGSLYETNILIVTNFADIKEYYQLFEQEKANVSYLICDKNPDISDITRIEKDQIGPYEHIINILSANTNMGLTDNGYNDNDITSFAYDILKVETEYLVSKNSYATLCTAIIDNGASDFEISSASIKACVEGLGKPLGNHKLICNGVIAEKDVPLSAVIPTTIYMSSKYGQILAGQVLELNNGKFEN